MSNPIPLIITGANGRMGQTLIRLIDKDDRFQLVGATEQPSSPAMGADAGINTGCGEMGVKISGELTSSRAYERTKNAKPVIIDFTSPASTLSHVDVAQKNGYAMVIGTTGLSKEQTNAIEVASKKIPIVLAPNMSVGMNLLFKLVGEVAKKLGAEYDLEIFEAHHRLKKDAPSGSALKIAQVLCEATGRNFPDDVRKNRDGMIGERGAKEIGLQVLRGGDIVGEHTVFFCGDGERVEIKHSATSRNAFAMGALRAAAWIAHQQPGLYGMGEVMGNLMNNQ